jgi:hypothetical protein
MGFSIGLLISAPHSLVILLLLLLLLLLYHQRKIEIFYGQLCYWEEFMRFKSVIGESQDGLTRIRML